MYAIHLLGFNGLGFYSDNDNNDNNANTINTSNSKSDSNSSSNDNDNNKRSEVLVRTPGVRRYLRSVFKISCLFLRPRPWQFEISDSTDK